MTALDDDFGSDNDKKNFCKCVKPKLPEDIKPQYISKEEEYEQTGAMLVTEFSNLSSIFAELDIIKNSVKK